MSPSCECAAAKFASISSALFSHFLRVVEMPQFVERRAQVGMCFRVVRQQVYRRAHGGQCALRGFRGPQHRRENFPCHAVLGKALGHLARGPHGIGETAFLHQRQQRVFLPLHGERFSAPFRPGGARARRASRRDAPCSSLRQEAFGPSARQRHRPRCRTGRGGAQARECPPLARVDRATATPPGTPASSLRSPAWRSRRPVDEEDFPRPVPIARTTCRGSSWPARASALARGSIDRSVPRVPSGRRFAASSPHRSAGPACWSC